MLFRPTVHDLLWEAQTEQLTFYFFKPLSLMASFPCRGVRNNEFKCNHSGTNTRATLIKHERQRRGLFAQQTRGRDNNALALRQLPPHPLRRKSEI